MKQMILISGLAGVLGLGMLAAPGTASATCAERKMTGTVIGGVGGALIGNSIARGGGGAIIGGLGGAVLGHQIAGSGCRRARYTASSERSLSRTERAEAPRAVRYVYYDQYGNAVSEGPAPRAAGAPAAYAALPTAACHTESRAYYDNRGALMRTPVQVCDR